MFNPFSSYDDATVVFTFGGFSVGVWIVFLVAVALFVGFFVRMIQHENNAYRAIIEHTPIEKGPVAEGEPPPY